MKKLLILVTVACFVARLAACSRPAGSELDAVDLQPTLAHLNQAMQAPDFAPQFAAFTKLDPFAAYASLIAPLAPDDIRAKLTSYPTFQASLHRFASRYKSFADFLQMTGAAKEPITLADLQKVYHAGDLFIAHNGGLATDAPFSTHDAERILYVSLVLNVLDQAPATTGSGLRLTAPAPATPQSYTFKTGDYTQTRLQAGSAYATVTLNSNGGASVDCGPGIAPVANPATQTTTCTSADGSLTASATWGNTAVQNRLDHNSGHIVWNTAPTGTPSNYGAAPAPYNPYAGAGAVQVSPGTQSQSSQDQSNSPPIPGAPQSP